MPYIVGTGLLALDLIVQRSPDGVHFSASGGGTCGNVLAILARMGWRSSWLGAIDDSLPGHVVRSEMKRAGVCLHSALPEEAPPVPVFAHHINVDAHGHSHHWFSRDCPHCGRKLPRYEHPSDAWLNQQGRYASEADVFFADRLSGSVIELAERAKRNDALVIYEPSVASDGPWMADMIGLADIVKFSSDRSSALEGFDGSKECALWIETMGKKGLKWTFGETAPHLVPAVHNPSAIDACGAGDWFTSALIFLLSRTGSKPADLDAAHLSELMSVASGVAAWSCGFLGARGALYDAPIYSVYKQLCVAPAAAPQNLTRPKPRFDDAGEYCAFS